MSEDNLADAMAEIQKMKKNIVAIRSLGEKIADENESLRTANASLAEKVKHQADTLESCEFCEEGAECCKKYDNSYGEMLAPMIVVCTACWNRSHTALAASLAREAGLRNVLERIRDGHYKNTKCLAPSKCCPENRLCFPCIVNDALSPSGLNAPSGSIPSEKPCQDCTGPGHPVCHEHPRGK